MRGFIILVAGIAWLLALYFGWLYFVEKTYNSKPEVDASVSAEQQRYTQNTAEEVRKRQRRLQQDREQRIKDLQRR